MLLQAWQWQSFRYYDSIGEIRFSAQFYARALQNLRLYVGRKDASGEIEEIDDPKALAILDDVQDPGGGRAGMLRAYGQLKWLIGEGYMLVTPGKEQRNSWEFVSPAELIILAGGRMIRQQAPGLPQRSIEYAEQTEWQPEQPDQGVAYRYWTPHPMFSAQADAPMRGVLLLCDELERLTAAVRARAVSRMAGAGILCVPDEISQPPPEPVGDEDPQEDIFLRDLIAASVNPITDPGTASAVTPMIVRGAAEYLKELRHLQIHNPLETYPEEQLRNECIRRIALSLDFPPEVLLGLSDTNHWNCVDDQTELLTASGWKRHHEIEIGEEALTLNHETGLSEWLPIQNVSRFEVENVAMRSLETRYHSSLTTMNHRWPVLRLTGREGRWERAWTYSDELKTTHRLITAAPSAEALRSRSNEISDALVELVAWLWTEGRISERSGRKTPQVSICQSHAANPENVLRIRAALEALHGAAVASPMRPDRRSSTVSPPQWRETQRGRMTLFSLNCAAAADLLKHVSADRVVSIDFIRSLSASQLALFIETSVRGDGSRMRSGCLILGQSDAKRLAPFELAAILLGRSPSDLTTTHMGFTRHTQQSVTVSGRQTVRLKKHQLREQRYTGTIWCPTTANGSWLARRNGKVYYTGNSWQIDEQTWKAHLQPVAQSFCEDLTASYFRAACRDEGVAGWEDLCVWYDAAEVINHPDRTADARQGFVDGAVGGEFYRRAIGATEDDAPNEEERAERIGIATRDSSLAWYGIPSVRAGGIEPEPGVVESAQGESPALPGPPPSPTGAEVEKGPPEQEPVTAALAAASAMALARCRELAGSRLRTQVRRGGCRECADAIEGVPNALVATALSVAGTGELELPSARELVAGGAASLRDLAPGWGLSEDEAALLAERVERHAALTLFDAEPKALAVKR